MTFRLLAAVLERNKVVNRRIARVLGCAGYEVQQHEQPEKVTAEQLGDPTLILADAFDADGIMRLLFKLPRTRAILYTGEPLDRLLAKALEEPRLVALMGRPSFEVPPREDDLLHITRRIHTPESAPFEAHLAWGASGFHYSLTDERERDAAVKETIALTAKLGAPKRVGEMLGELSHELLMNAMWDAPVDAHGNARYAHDRKMSIKLDAGDAATLRVASDGVRIAIEVQDRFGRLERRHVFGGLTRSLKKTRVTGLFDLDLNLREFKQLPKTIHFQEGEAA
jgi:hypothetical protein